jgi:hypothetical protein
MPNGHDAQEGQYGDLVSKGIIDPTKVVRTALQDAGFDCRTANDDRGHGCRDAARRRHGLLVERFQSSNRRIRGMESQRCNCEVSWNRSSSCINKRKARTNAPGLVISHRIAEYAASSLLSGCWRSASLAGSVCRAFCSHFIMRTSAWSGSLLMLSLYNFIICVVAAALYVVVNELEPNRRLASALRIVIVAVAVAAILGHLTR